MEVIGDRFVDVSENELEICYSEQDRFAVSIRPPWPDADWIWTHPAGQVPREPSAENRQLSEYLQRALSSFQRQQLHLHFT